MLQFHRKGYKNHLSYSVWNQSFVGITFQPISVHKCALDGYSCHMTCLFKTSFKGTEIMAGDNGLEIQYVLVTARNTNAHEV